MARKTLTASIAALLLATTLPLGSIAEDVTEKHRFMKGDIPVDDETFMENIITEAKMKEDGVYETYALKGFPTKVDLSTSIYFPPIINQGYIGSCTPCAVVYYQFTYEANKLNKITTTAENAYSPNWPFYYTQNGNTADKGCSFTSVYDFLKRHGALHMSDDPYNITYDSSKPLPSNYDKIRESLNTRLSSYTNFEIPGTGTPIVSVNDSDLEMAKIYLNSGKILRTSSTFSFDEGTSGNDTIYYRCNTKEDDGHSFVVVGYDDTKAYDVNGNGIIEESEKGAFKIANSWGTDFGNNGYVWVLYDALNQVSNIPGNWESSLSGDRIAAFSVPSSDMNRFSAINVKNYEVDYVVELKFSNVGASFVIPTLVRKVGDSESVSGRLAPHKETNSDFTLIFDCADICQDVETYNKDFYLGVYLTGQERRLNYGYVTDNRGNRIETMYSVPGKPTGRYLAPIDLIRGDVNYNGTITNADVILVTRYCSGWDNLSNIQIYLADYNGDGKVTNTDVILMQRYITNNS